MILRQLLEPIFVWNRWFKGFIYGCLQTFASENMMVDMSLFPLQTMESRRCYSWNCQTLIELAINTDFMVVKIRSNGGAEMIKNFSIVSLLATRIILANHLRLHNITPIFIAAALLFELYFGALHILMLFTIFCCLVWFRFHRYFYY